MIMNLQKQLSQKQDSPGEADQLRNKVLYQDQVMKMQREQIQNLEQNVKDLNNKVNEKIKRISINEQKIGEIEKYLPMLQA